MIEVKRIIEEIKDTSSRTEKEEILRKNKDNKLFKEVLYFVFNDYIITGLSDKKINKKVDVEGDDIDDLFEYLKRNNTGSDVNIATVQKYISNQPEQLQELYKCIATKNIKMGVNAKTINKVFGKGFIPTFNVMLADNYIKHEDKVEKFIITEKLDGCRGVIIKENGNVTIMSRQGQRIEGLIDIENEAKLLPDNMIYDGELLLRNDNNLDSADLYRATVKEIRKDGIKKNVEFYTFDMLPVDEFKHGQSKLGCYDRKRKLINIVNELNLIWIKNVDMLYVGEDKEVIYKLLDKVEQSGKEGLMINTFDGRYECKRSRQLLKLKTMQTVDLRVVGFEEGNNKYKNKLGRLNVEYKGSIVGVGSGFSDEERVEIWQNQEKYLGKICEIQYFEESSNQQGGISLRFPVFTGFRFDKDDVSYY